MRGAPGSRALSAAVAACPRPSTRATIASGIGFGIGDIPVDTPISIRMDIAIVATTPQPNPRANLSSTRLIDSGYRRQKMMTSAPTTQIAEPSMSHRSGRAPSTTRSQTRDDAT